MKPKPKRDVVKVIDRMLEIIPESETEIIKRLNCCKYDAGFRAPELHYLIWTEISAILTVNWNPNQTWAPTVAKIFSGEME